MFRTSGTCDRYRERGWSGRRETGFSRPKMGRLRSVGGRGQQYTHMWFMHRRNNESFFLHFIFYLHVKLQIKNTQISPMQEKPWQRAIRCNSFANPGALLGEMIKLTHSYAWLFDHSATANQKHNLMFLRDHDNFHPNEPTCTQKQTMHPMMGQRAERQKEGRIDK